MKDLKVYVIIAAVLLTLYFIAQYNRPKAIDWSETLINTDKIPFGTYILFNRINDIFPGDSVQTFREPVYNVLNDHDIKNGTYIIICDRVNLNEYDYNKLTKFIKDGNDVFIAASFFNGEFKKKLKIETESELKPGGIRFLNKSLDSNLHYIPEKGMGDTYFSKLDTVKAVILGGNDFGHSNFIKYQIGKGALYLNANPFLFSNYSLLNTHGAAYASIALSYPKKSSNLLWDEFYTQGREGDDNTMRLFLARTQLRWAFYIAFFGLIAFVLYEAKRRQRIIPVIEPLRNTTLEFVNVVGQVYYEKRNNANIAHKKILYLLEHLREQYQLKTNKLDDEFVEKLTSKLGIDRAFANELIGYIQYISNQQSVNDHELIELNKLIEKLYSLTT
jgi:hypothetical protein